MRAEHTVAPRLLAGYGRLLRSLNPRSAPVVRALVLPLVLAGCVAVDGGAVELSWDIRQADGMALDDACDASRIAQVGLCARRCDDDAVPAGVCQGALVCPKAQWSCGDFSGATEFDLPEGPTELFIEAYCQDGSRAQGVQVPAPIVRSISKGRVSQLNALLITLPPPAAGEACP